jgi:hypothetical protein
MEGSQLQHSKLVIKTDPGADRAVMELVEVDPDVVKATAGP